MAKKQRKYMKLKISTETGDVVKKVDEHNVDATPVDAAEIQQVYQSQGFKHVGTILHTHSSPGCVYIVIGGWGFRICGFPPPP
jgi:hypothetical protein